jgi:hypothetical protein
VGKGATFGLGGSRVTSLDAPRETA